MSNKATTPYDIRHVVTAVQGEDVDRYVALRARALGAVNISLAFVDLRMTVLESFNDKKQVLFYVGYDFDGVIWSAFCGYVEGRLVVYEYAYFNTHKQEITPEMRCFALSVFVGVLSADDIQQKICDAKGNANIFISVDKAYDMPNDLTKFGIADARRMSGNNDVQVSSFNIMDAIDQLATHLYRFSTKQRIDVPISGVAADSENKTEEADASTAMPIAVHPNMFNSIASPNDRIGPEITTVVTEKKAALFSFRLDCRSNIFTRALKDVFATVHTTHGSSVFDAENRFAVTVNEQTATAQSYVLVHNRVSSQTAIRILFYKYQYNKKSPRFACYHFATILAKLTTMLTTDNDSVIKCNISFGHNPIGSATLTLLPESRPSVEFYESADDNEFDMLSNRYVNAINKYCEPRKQLARFADNSKVPRSEQQIDIPSCPTSCPILFYLMQRMDDRAIRQSDLDKGGPAFDEFLVNVRNIVFCMHKLEHVVAHEQVFDRMDEGAKLTLLARFLMFMPVFVGYTEDGPVENFSFLQTSPVPGAAQLDCEDMAQFMLFTVSMLRKSRHPKLQIFKQLLSNRVLLNVFISAHGNAGKPLFHFVNILVDEAWLHRVSLPPAERKERPRRFIPHVLLEPMYNVQPVSSYDAVIGSEVQLSKEEPAILRPYITQAEAIKKYYIDVARIYNADTAFPQTLVPTKGEAIGCSVADLMKGLQDEQTYLFDPRRLTKAECDVIATKFRNMNQTINVITMPQKCNALEVFRDNPLNGPQLGFYIPLPSSNADRSLVMQDISGALAAKYKYDVRLPAIYVCETLSLSYFQLTPLWMHKDTLRQRAQGQQQRDMAMNKQIATSRVVQRNKAEQIPRRDGTTPGKGRVQRRRRKERH